MRIKWNAPDEVRGAAEPIIERWAHLAPGWMRQLTVAYEPGDSENIASAGVQPEYRRGHLFIHPKWLEKTAAERELILVHELFHVPLQPIVGLGWDLINEFAPEETREFLHEQWRLVFEGAVQDLAESAIAGVAD